MTAEEKAEEYYKYWCKSPKGGKQAYLDGLAEGRKTGYEEGYKKATERAYERQRDLTDTYIKDGEKIKHLEKENKISEEIIIGEQQEINELRKENAELKAHCKAVDEVNEKMKCCGNCINRGLNKDDISQPCCDCKYYSSNKKNDHWEMEK